MTDQAGIEETTALTPGAVRALIGQRDRAWEEMHDLAARLEQTTAQRDALMAALERAQHQGGLCWCVTWREHGFAGECPDCWTRSALALVRAARDA